MRVNGQIVLKPNFLVSDQDQIVIDQKMPYVSRAGEKLAGANKRFQISFDETVVLDIGASTGGFTDYAIQNGAKKVYALDVGTNQLAEKLRLNPLVVNWEQTNLKDLPSMVISEKVDIIVCDVSFISLSHVFSAINDLTIRDHPEILLLIKPQFELGNFKIKKFQGKVPPEFLDKIIQQVIKDAFQNGYRLVKIVPSDIVGKKMGNQEFFA